jgi:hypothetical protein
MGVLAAENSASDGCSNNEGLINGQCMGACMDSLILESKLRKVYRMIFTTMSLRLWLFVFAIVGFGLSTSLQAQEQDGEADQGPTVRIPFTLPVIIVESVESAIVSQREEAERTQREKYDLVAQQGMNAATQVMKWASVVSLVFVALGTGLLVWTLKLTREANNAAQRAVSVTEKIGTAQTRAYLAISSVVRSESHFHQPSDIKFFVKNFGHSGALSVKVWAGFVVSDSTSPALPAIDEPLEYGFIAPGADVRVDMFRCVMDMPDEKIKVGELAEWVYGRIEYKTLTETRYTNFRYRSTAYDFMRDVFRQVGDGNDAN